MSQRTAPPGAPTTRATRLLACGIVAGPLLIGVGTRSVLASEEVSKRLTEKGLLHRVLNAADNPALPFVVGPLQAK